MEFQTNPNDPEENAKMQWAKFSKKIFSQEDQQEGFWNKIKQRRFNDDPRRDPYLSRNLPMLYKKVNNQQLEDYKRLKEQENEARKRDIAKKKELSTRKLIFAKFMAGRKKTLTKQLSRQVTEGTEYNTPRVSIKPK